MNANEEIDADENFDQVIQDIAAAQRRAQRAKHLEAAREFADNGYELMLQLAKATKDRLDEQDAIIEDLLEHEGSVIQPELYEQIVATLELGRELCRRLAADAAALPADIKQLAMAYMTASELLDPELAEAAVEMDADDDAEEGEEIEAGDDAGQDDAATEEEQEVA